MCSHTALRYLSSPSSLTSLFLFLQPVLKAGRLTNVGSSLRMNDDDDDDYCKQNTPCILPYLSLFFLRTSRILLWSRLLARKWRGIQKKDFSAVNQLRLIELQEHVVVI